MRKFLLIFFVASISFAQIKTSQLPIKTAVDSNKYFIVLDTTDVNLSQRTQRVKWNKFRLDIPNYAYTWSKPQIFSDDSLKINGLWYDFPNSRVANSVLYDSLGNGILKWKALSGLAGFDTSKAYKVTGRWDMNKVFVDTFTLKNRTNTLQEGELAYNTTLGDSWVIFGYGLGQKDSLESIRRIRNENRTVFGAWTFKGGGKEVLIDNDRLRFGAGSSFVLPTGSSQDYGGEMLYQNYRVKYWDDNSMVYRTLANLSDTTLTLATRYWVNTNFPKLSSTNTWTGMNTFNTGNIYFNSPTFFSGASYIQTISSNNHSNLTSDFTFSDITPSTSTSGVDIIGYKVNITSSGTPTANIHYGVYSSVGGYPSGGSKSYGVYGYAYGAGTSYGIYGKGGTYAGYFEGDVYATGTITGTFSGNLTGNVTGNISGNAGTVTNGVYTSGSYANPSWLTSLAWSKISSTPTTLAGYGITDGVSTSRSISTSGSLTGGGNLSADRTLSLVNDNASPGVNKYYGTDATGTKGFFDLPSGGGITSLNGLTGSTQTFTNDANVTISSAGTTHTLGWNGQLSIARGGTNASSFSTSNGLIYYDGTRLATTTVTAGQLYSSGLFDPTYGELYDNISTSTITTNGTSYVKWTGSTIGTCANITGNTTNDNLTVNSGYGGVYEITYTATFSVDTAGDYYWTVNINGAGLSKMRTIITAITGTNYTVHCSGITTLNSSDVVDLGCFSTSGRIVTVKYANLNIVKISN